MAPVGHLSWFAEWADEVQNDYDRLHLAAVNDPQRAGHGGEATWLRFLQDWLPSDYEVATRKYILPEQGGEPFETDLIIFSPGYPARLRAREEVLAGGVAAAFSVKLTVNPAGIRDASDRAIALRRSLLPRRGSPQREMLGLFPVGLLAHSHSWKSQSSSPLENFKRNLTQATRPAQHPREILDIACVADLATMVTGRVPYLPPESLSWIQGQGLGGTGLGLAATALAFADAENDGVPVAVMVASIFSRLALSDPRLQQFGEALRLIGTLGSLGGDGRHWQLGDVYTDEVIRKLRARFLSGGEWGSHYI